MKCAGIEIGGSKLQLAIGSGDARIVERVRLAVEPGGGAEGIRRSILRELNSLRQRFDLSAIGMGFGGPVDYESGRVAASHQVDGWNGFELRAWLEQETGLPVRVDNDSNLAALAEATYGAGRGFRTVLYTNSGSGVGGGFVIDGRIFHGAKPGEVEFGQLRVGDSTVESLCSGWAVNRRVREAAEAHPESELARGIPAHRGHEAAALSGALDRQCVIARRILSEVAGIYAGGLSHAVHLLHPEVVILGGGLSGLGEPWREAVHNALAGSLMEDFRPGPEVRLSALGDEVVPTGALLLAAEEGRRRVLPSIANSAGTAQWMNGYVSRQAELLPLLPLAELRAVLEVFERAWREDRQIFVFGNGGSAANASHFATDLGKGSSDALGKRFRVLSLNDNSSWMTALGNDYSYEDVFLRQLQNYARPGDVALTMSVSGNSPNLVKAFEWCLANGVTTVAMVGAARGRLSELASHVLAVPDRHYGRVEDAHMTMGHMLCYAFMELRPPRENS